MYTYINFNAHLLTDIHMQPHLHTQTYIFINVNSHKFILFKCLYKRNYLDACFCAFICIHALICTWVCVYVCVCVCVIISAYKHISYWIISVDDLQNLTVTVNTIDSVSHIYEVHTISFQTFLYGHFYW